MSLRRLLVSLEGLVASRQTSSGPSGDVVRPFGPVQVVTVIGFRLRCHGGGSGVQNHTLEDRYRPLWG